MARDFARAFYRSHAWERTRSAALLRSHGLCEGCLRRGIVRPAKVVHHKVPLNPVNINDPAVSLGLDNLECLCQDCHAAEHTELGTYGKPHVAERPRVAFDEYGNVVRLGTGGLTPDGRDERTGTQG